MPQANSAPNYVEQNLMQGEKVIYWAKLHKIIFVKPVILILFGLASSWEGALVLWPRILTVISILWGISVFLNYRTSEFAVTNKRVIIKVGFIRRHSLEMLLTKIEMIAVDQGIFGRIFSYGTIVIGGTGGTKEKFYKLASALDFRKSVQEQIAAA